MNDDSYKCQDAELCCPICFEEFDVAIESRKPKLLNCLHTFCYSCIKVTTQENQLIECALCRKLHVLDTSQDVFDNTLIINQLKKNQEYEDEVLAARLQAENDQQMARLRELEERDRAVASLQQDLEECYVQGERDNQLNFDEAIGAVEQSIKGNSAVAASISTNSNNRLHLSAQASNDEFKIRDIGENDNLNLSDILNEEHMLALVNEERVQNTNSTTRSDSNNADNSLSDESNQAETAFFRHLHLSNSRTDRNNQSDQSTAVDRTGNSFVDLLDCALLLENAWNSQSIPNSLDSENIPSLPKGGIPIYHGFSSSSSSQSSIEHWRSAPSSIRNSPESSSASSSSRNSSRPSSWASDNGSAVSSSALSDFNQPSTSSSIASGEDVVEGSKNKKIIHITISDDSSDDCSTPAGMVLRPREALKTPVKSRSRALIRIKCHAPKILAPDLTRSPRSRPLACRPKRPAPAVPKKPPQTRKKPTV